MEQGELDTALTAYQRAGAEGWEDAVIFAQNALEKNPALFRTRLHLGEVLLGLGQTGEATTELDAALDAYQQAEIEPEETVDFFQRVLEIDSQRLFARLQLGQALLELDQVAEAIAELELAYEQDPAEARIPLVRALLAQARAARETGDWLAVQGFCVRVMQIDPVQPDALEMMREAINGLQQGIAADAPSFRAALGVNRHQLGEILSNAESHVHLLGVVALEANWRSLARKWAVTFADNPDFEITILCESDNMLFSKSFTYDTDVAENRRSFQELQFIRDRAIVDFPELLLGRVPKENEKVKIEIMHLPIPISIVQVDDRIFANLWLHEAEDYFEEITQHHPWHSLLEKYVSTYFGPALGRKYACDPKDPKDEVLEVFDHQRIPRGIYPRNSFYDTDYSQLVVWAFVFDRQGQLLIHRRSDNAKDNRGMWDKSVGGHTDLPDVDTSRAVPREVIEELFSDELREGKADFTVRAISDRDMIYLGEWRPDQRQRHPFDEIRAFSREWAFFRLRESQHLYSPRTLPDGTVRRLRVIADVFLFVAGPQLTDESLGDLKNSVFKLIELTELKDAMDKALRGDEVPEFDKSKSIPKFTPDLTNVMTGKLRDTLDKFSQYIKMYIRQ
jgi:tetratricopeptide (TPR) repeat protein